MKIFRLPHGEFKGGIFISKISPTITTSSFQENNFVMEENQKPSPKEVVFHSKNGQSYAIRIRKFTPRDCFRLMGVRDPDIDKLLAKEKTGAQIISNSKLYQLAGNSIVTNCMTAMFEELLYPSGEKYKEKDGQLSLF